MDAIQFAAVCFCANMLFGAVFILMLDTELFKWLASPPSILGVAIQPIIVCLWPIFLIMKLMKVGRFK